MTGTTASTEAVADVGAGNVAASTPTEVVLSASAERRLSALTQALWCHHGGISARHAHDALVEQLSETGIDLDSPSLRARDEADLLDLAVSRITGRRDPYRRS